MTWQQPHVEDIQQFHSVRIILTDIEGTTSSISFVKDVLFPYASEHLSGHIKQHQQQLKTLFEDVCALSQNVHHASDIKAITQQLQQWIADDVKATPLKTLQGQIWQQGYECGDYQAHMYPDAVERLRHWNDIGIPLYIYSSGSVKAQQLFFQYSDHGDLLPLFSGHFDTHIGTKQDANSYRQILNQLQQVYANLKPSEVLFLSDIEAELIAAETAGMQCAWLRREADSNASEQSERCYHRTFESIAIMPAEQDTTHI